jgi:hypothetical protein
MRFYGSESEIDLERHSEREFSAFTWMPLQDIAAQVRVRLLSLCCNPSRRTLETRMPLLRNFRHS